MAEEVQSAEVLSCRDEDGITTGLVDAMIGILRVLVIRDLSPEQVQAALADLFQDPDLEKLRAALQTA